MQALFFIKKYWKILGIGIGAILIVLFVNNYIDNMKTAAYNRGVQVERNYWQKSVAEENKKNREIESRMAKAIEGLETTLQNKEYARVEKETIHLNTIETRVESNPIYQECVVDPEVVQELNAIRSWDEE